MRLRIYTSEKAASLKKVAMDIADVLRDDKHFTSVDIVYGPVYDLDMIENSDASIVVMPFDVIWATTYFLISWEYLNMKKPSIFYTTIEGQVLKTAMKIWISRDLKIAVNSQYTAEKLREVGVNPVAVIPHGIDVKKIQSLADSRDETRRSLGVENEFVVGYIASGISRKCHDLFSEVVRLTSSMDNSIRFLILTDENGAKYYSSTDAVVIAKFGQYPEDYVYRLYHAMDVYAHGSCSEGFGLPILEALAAGKLVVHPDYMPLTEITTSDTSIRVPITSIDVYGEGGGILYEKHVYNPKTFAEKIIDAKKIVSSDTKKKITKKAINRAKEFDKFRVYRELGRLLLGLK